jgi:hypothetical protein
MKVSRCSAAQMIHLWPQAERGGPSIGARDREHGITAPTCDCWRTKGGGLMVPAAPRVREGAQEQASLTRLRAERDLAVDALKALLGQRSSRWRPAVRPSRSWVPVGSGRVAPRACGRGSARRSPSGRAPRATRSGPCQSTRWPAGSSARETDAWGRCADAAARVGPRSTGRGAGHGRQGRSARAHASGDGHAVPCARELRRLRGPCGPTPSSTPTAAAARPSRG